jgi:hypothetical protein
MYDNNSVEFCEPFCFSIYAYIESNIYICKLILFIVNNVCYFDLDLI